MPKRKEIEEQPDPPRAEIFRSKGVATRYTRNEKGEIIEVCRLREDGRPGLPILKLDPVEKRGGIEFRSTYDSFSGGVALATDAYSDEARDARMTYEEWRDAYLAWFQKNGG